MGIDDRVFADEASARLQGDLRQQVAAALLDRADLITADAVAIFPHSGLESLDADYCGRLGNLLTLLLTFAVRDARVDSRSGFVADLHRTIGERMVPIDRVFTFVYFTERTALDELALDERLGATSEPWAVVGQIVRRGSFDLLAAYIERAQLEPTEAAVVDKLTTLHTRPMLDAVLAKEVERAGRFGDDVSVILFDVDRLSTINEEHGYGVGDRILERLGILIRQYFTAARLGGPALGGFDRGAADANRRRARERARRARPRHGRGAARIHRPPQRPAGGGDTERCGHQRSGRGRRHHRSRAACSPTQSSPSIEQRAGTQPRRARRRISGALRVEPRSQAA